MDTSPDSDSARQGFSRRIVTPLCVAGLLVLPGLATVWFIHRYSVNIIYADQWYDISIIHRFHEGTLGIGDLWAQHGENRILIPNLLVLVLANTVHFNIVIEDYLSGVFKDVDEA